MTDEGFINILIAEDNDVSREMMAGILRTQGYKIHGVTDGEAAIQLVQEENIDCALVDINMAPKGGFEFVEYLLTKGIKVPVVIITADGSSDILMKASSLGVSQVIQKPIEPERLIKTVHRILKRSGLNPEPMGVQAHETTFSPEELMQKTIALAENNAASGKGRPFGAIVVDAQGKILGEGISAGSSRADPTAHAEVMAIRKAAERLEATDLSECVLYCSSEPTMMGKSLVISVGIKTVYIGFTHSEAGALYPKEEQSKPEYKQLMKDEALAMFKKAREKQSGD